MHTPGIVLPLIAMILFARRAHSWGAAARRFGCRSSRTWSTTAAAALVHENQNSHCRIQPLAHSYSSTSIISQTRTRHACTQTDSTEQHDIIDTNTNTSTTDGTNIVAATSIQLVLDTAEDTREFGALLCAFLLQDKAAPAVVFLQGDLGAGKTCLAQGFVRCAVQDWTHRVTSPTYLLSNVYYAMQQHEGEEKDSPLEIHHMDLYRLSGEPRDLIPLNLPHVFTNCISLIEWPLRLGDTIPEHRLEVSMHIVADDSTVNENDQEEDKVRTVKLQPFGAVWEERLQRLVDDGYVDDLLADDEDD